MKIKKILIITFMLSFTITFFIGFLDVTEPFFLDMALLILSSLILSFFVTLAVLAFTYLYSKMKR